MSAHSLIVSAHALILSARPLIVWFSPYNVAYSPTVPSGDTPCLTAGDAQRANPWGSDAQTSDAGSVAQHLPPFSLSLFSVVTSSRRHTLHITNWKHICYECDNVTTKSSIFLEGERKNTPSTLSVRHRRCRKVVLLSVHFSTGSPSLSFGYHPRLSIVRLCRRRLCVDADAEEVQWGYSQKHTYHRECERVTIGEVENESIRKSIDDMQGWNWAEYPSCSPTVPGGDTPCLTAGDARRVNPWISEMHHSPTPAVSHSSHASARLSYPPPRFQCDTAGVGVSFVHIPHGFALTIVRVSPAVKHGAPPPEASVTLYCYDYGCGGWAVVEYWQSCRWSWSQTVHRLFSMCLRRWYDYRLSRYAGAEDFLSHPHYPRRRCELLYFAAGLVLTKLCVELPTDSA